MQINNEQKMTIAGLLLAVVVGGAVYAYNHFLVPAKPEEILDSPKRVFQEPKPRPLVVQVCGAVVREGVYRLDPGDRMLTALQLAGGSRDGADLAAINLAEVVKDGQKIVVPFRDHQNIGASERGKSEKQGIRNNQDRKININTASVQELDELPGVGPATARKIIEARPFSKIEDLLKIPRFGKSKLDKLKDRITI